MGFADRRYSAGPPSMFRMTSAVKLLLIANVALFVVYFLTARLLEPLWYLLSLTPSMVVTKLAVWQLVTYLFLHSTAGFGHILMNMLTLWMFGTPLEEAWGTRRFVQYYFFCGVGAGVCVVVLNYLFGAPNFATIGASGAIYGLLIAFGMTFPRAVIYFFGFFPIEARWFVAIMAGIVLLSALASGAGGSVSHFAHLGGMVFGVLWLKTSLGQGAQRRRGPSGPGLVERVRMQYKEWKLQRAKKKFQVYLKKHGTRRDDDYIN